VPERVRVQRRYFRPRPDGFGDFPDPLARDPALGALAHAVLARDHGERRSGSEPSPLGGQVVAQDGARAEIRRALTPGPDA